jgi:hypothetical protein
MEPTLMAARGGERTSMSDLNRSTCALIGTMAFAEQHVDSVADDVGIAQLSSGGRFLGLLSLIGPCLPVSHISFLAEHYSYALGAEADPHLTAVPSFMILYPPLELWIIAGEVFEL